MPPLSVSPPPMLAFSTEPASSKPVRHPATKKSSAASNASTASSDPPNPQHPHRPRPPPTRRNDPTTSSKPIPSSTPASASPLPAATSTPPPEDPIPPVTLLLSASAFDPYPPALYEKGMTVVISRYKQNPDAPLTGHKSTSYFDRLLALREAQQSKAGEALWFTAATTTSPKAPSPTSSSSKMAPSPRPRSPSPQSQSTPLPSRHHPRSPRTRRPPNLPLQNASSPSTTSSPPTKSSSPTPSWASCPSPPSKNPPVSAGTPGPTTTQLRHAYQQTLESESIE